jgi:hypothetical protein
VTGEVLWYNRIGMFGMIKAGDEFYSFDQCVNVSAGDKVQITTLLRPKPSALIVKVEGKPIDPSPLIDPICKAQSTL